MCLSNLPASSEGVICVVVMNTALSISIFKGIVRSVLHIVDNRLAPFSSSSSSILFPDYSDTESFEFPLHSSDDCVRELRSRRPAKRFDAVSSCKQPQHDCPVCLIQFKPDSEINCLSCGHVFHKACLEKWLDYRKVTCPLCRSPVMPEEEDTSCSW